MTSEVVDNRNHSNSNSTALIRDQILEAFLKASDHRVSGAWLSEQLGLTRAAVWKHIRSLEELGFSFSAATRRGYRLEKTPDLVLGPLLQPRLANVGEFGRTVIWSPEVDSTNALALRLARQGAPHGTLVTALVQTGGRGRRGRGWVSPRGGLWMSILLGKSVPLFLAHELTLLASVAVFRALQKQGPFPLSIKWPNDILCDGRKVCGILAEMRADGENVQYAVLGIGINTNVPLSELPAALNGTATSLSLYRDNPISHLDLVAAILNELEPWYEGLVRGESQFAAVADEWRAHSATLGRLIQVVVGRHTYQGIAERLDADGVLQLRLDDGTLLPVHSGEVLFSENEVQK
ncbi:MAG: biotin--[acetyl-CoA-carboxylase] ligase [Alicyclobacillus herbarius]|uniref:biotin--[acetyl-CoA-carboxylase] ligase n=1 Tax=Alicyclobacillus herbarius TaxID=122960 RepID=UPI002357C307|nr:biotin--[acetyl-CoA-carboxylase] ligase [Alicyclobacillus herbarius]MCL6631434.1 biotin--[acetyl-CoA-carboxylase] ligase [Alicyclobacillus herbarius]